MTLISSAPSTSTHCQELNLLKQPGLSPEGHPRNEPLHGWVPWRRPPSQHRAPRQSLPCKAALTSVVIKGCEDSQTWGASFFTRCQRFRSSSSPMSGFINASSCSRAASIVCGVESSAFKPVLQLVDAALAAHPGMSSTARVAEVGRTPIDADVSEKVTPDTVSAVLALDDHPGPAGRALWGRPDILDVHRLNVSATTHSGGGRSRRSSFTQRGDHVYPGV